MGLLCIVSNAEGLQENVLDGETGWVVPKRQPKLLADKIQEVIAMNNLDLLKIRERAQDRIQQQFNLEQQKNQWINFFKEF